MKLGFMAVVSGAALALSACGSCDRAGAADGAAPSASSSGSVVAEELPRCRAGAEKLAFSSDDVIVGDVAIGSSGLLIGVIRIEAGKHIASVVRVSLDLSSSQVVDLGTAFGDDPPPSPRWNGETPFVATRGPPAVDGGPRVRTLHVSALDGGAVGRAFAPVTQQSDESTAFDLAWSDTGAALAAWDEDAPPGKSDGGAPTAPDRGFVKVELLADGDGKGERVRRVASPETSDAESPRLIARPSGFWLAWLARRVVEDDAHFVEGPGEKRSFRWVEAVALDPKGEPVGPVRKVSPEKGRAVGFELARSGADLVVMVQDEAALAEGAGARIVRYRVTDGASPEAAELVDGGVGQTLAELVPAPAAAATFPDGGEPWTRWLAWSDTAERTHMTPLGSDLLVAGRTSTEPVLDGARVLAHAPPDVIYALVGEGAVPGEKGASKNAGSRSELRRFICR